MEENENSNKKIILPSCQKCNGLLNITINPLNFSIEYECEFDKQHHNTNIFFKTFERFYLKEKEILKCSKCNLNLENSELFKCEICKCIYCCTCSIEDIKKNGHEKELYKYQIKKCMKHNMSFNTYCLSCKKNLCLYCIKEENIHENHEIKNYIEIMPSSNNIKNLKSKIKEKLKYVNILIEKIDKWKKEIIRKTEELKQNLRDEISLFEKIIFNYNYSFPNYTYYQIFNSINKYIKNINNEYLIRFNKCYEFKKQTELLNQLFSYFGNHKREEEVVKDQSIKFTKHYHINDGVIERINNNYIIDKTRDNYIRIHNYNNLNNTFYFFRDTKILFPEKIYSISSSTIQNKIFICLLNYKIVKILEYDLNEKTMKLDEKIIHDVNSVSDINHFFKCIQIGINYFLTSDKDYVKIWTNESGSFTEFKKIEINAKTFDLLLFDEQYIISSQPEIKTLTIFDKLDLFQVKIISDIDCIKSFKCFYQIKDIYILVSCEKGIGLFNIKTKEMIQYYMYNDPYYNRMAIDHEDNIYILNIRESFCEYIIKLVKGKINDGEIIFMKDYEEIKSKEGQLNLTCLYNKTILLWKNNIYSIREN